MAAAVGVVVCVDVVQEPADNHHNHSIRYDDVDCRRSCILLHRGRHSRGSLRIGETVIAAGLRSKIVKLWRAVVWIRPRIS